MKRFLIPVIIALFIFSVNVAYDVGQKEMQQFKALCESPGVLCAVHFGPVWMRTHSEVDLLPYVTYEFAGMPWRSR